jgi:type IV pilus assembly protein PilN
MNIKINLATRPFTDLGPIFKRLRVAMVIFAVVSIGLGFGLHFLHAKAEAARAREHSLDAQIARINSERQGYRVMMQQPDNKQVLDQANNLNALFDQKAFSWTLAMEDLETVLPGGVQVTTLEPVRDEKTGEITLKLKVAGPRDKAVELVQNLEHSRHFLRPAITGESMENAGGPGQPLEPVSMSNKVNVDLTAEYNPATLSELPPTRKKSDEESDKSNKASPATAPKSAGAAAGPGLRRPPFMGIAKPPVAGHVKPNVAQPTAPALMSPQAMRQNRNHSYPQNTPAPIPQQPTRPRPTGPGGQQ